jgi:pyruvyltransferase
MLSPLLTRALSGRPVVFRNTAPRLFAVGSLLKFASKGDRVWGTGFIDQQDSVTPGVIIYAVRGPLTRQKLMAQGVDCPEVYGDPGLLLPAIYPAKKTVRRGIGIIPHYVDLDRVRKEVRQPGVRIIDIRAGIDKVLQQALSCEVILSSSLHGCILADAYGIPHRWVEIGDKVVGSGFKFRDYYASTNRDPAAVDWRRSIDIDTAVKMALDMPPPEIDLGSLVKSFPYLMKYSEKFTKLTLPYANNKNYDAMPNLASSVSQKVAIQEVHNPQAEIKSSGSDSAKPEVINEKIAIFGAVTENYVEYMIASLRSFKKYNGDNDFDYFIIGHAFSARTQRLMNKYGIGYINLNLAKDFPRKQRHRYPGECFWIFKGPELFSDRGYRYSISVDGDIYCNRKLELEWLPQLEHLAGIDRGCSCGEFLQNLGQLDMITRKLGSAGLNSRRRATNTGVLFYNNSELVAKNFYQHIVDIYQRSEKAGIVRGGDDSTLAMLLALHADIKMHMLPSVWNFYQGMNKQQTSVDDHKELELKKKVQDAFIVHLIHLKPWRHYSKFPNPWVQHYIGEWRKLWPATRNQRRIHALNRVQDNRNDRLIKSRNRAANRCANEGTLPIAVYWYRGVHLNMGDEITPYLLAKIEGLMPEEIPRLTKEPARTSGLVLVSIGSVLRLCHKNTLIWGSGIRTIDQPVAKAYRFCAVRGPLTRRRLLQLGYDCPEIYGDPALLLPRYFRPQVSRKYDLGIIPHLVDYDQLIKRYGADKNVLVIDVKTGDIESIIRQILSCKVTVSSSLHGIVLSVAYGIPTRWLKCSDKIMGDDSKFYDFFASLEPAMLDVFDERTVSIVAEESRYEKFKPLHIHSSDITPKQLIAATHKYESVLDLDLLLNAYPGEYLTCLKKMA